MVSRSSSVSLPALRPSRTSTTKPTTRSRSDHASQPVASSRHSRYPAVPPQSSGGQAPEPTGADGTGFLQIPVQEFLDADLVLPVVVHVVEVGKTAALAEPEPGKGNVRAFGRQLEGARGVKSSRQPHKYLFTRKRAGEAFFRLSDDPITPCASARAQGKIGDRCTEDQHCRMLGLNLLVGKRDADLPLACHSALFRNRPRTGGPGGADRHHNPGRPPRLRYLRRLGGVRARVDPRAHRRRARSCPRQGEKGWPQVCPQQGPGSSRSGRHEESRYLGCRTRCGTQCQAGHALPLCRAERRTAHEWKARAQRLEEDWPSPAKNPFCTPQLLNKEKLS